LQQYGAKRVDALLPYSTISMLTKRPMLPVHGEVARDISGGDHSQRFDSTSLTFLANSRLIEWVGLLAALPLATLRLALKVWQVAAPELRH
jgi:hypothetical protein